MKLKKVLSFLLVMILCLSGVSMLSGCGDDSNRVVIYSSDETYINEYLLGRLKEQFPQYDIVIEYRSTGDNAALLKTEGTATACDIVWGLEVGYLDKMLNLMADISSYSNDHYVDDMKMGDGKYLVAHRYSGCIVIDPAILQKKGVPTPTCYEDLLNPVYKNLIAMPNPKSSGTGYIYLKSLVNAWGEDKAFQYFDDLYKSGNLLQFTSSGSLPISLLMQGEIGIALGMTAQAVKMKNEGHPLEILFFEPGAPYTACGYGIVEGKQNDPAVKEVFDFFYNTLVQEEKDQFLPETIFKDQEMKVEGYPTDINYADMSGNTADEKSRLLAKWIY